MSNLSYPLWLDSYLTWASSEKCCLISVSTQKRCTNETLDCEPCLSLDFKNRPFSRDFMKFLPMFLNSSATPECNIVGHMFGDDIRLHAGKITTSRFKMFHSKLASQSDYINSYKAITQALDEFGHSEVFAYSYFYPYYDQFLNLETQMIIIIVIGVSTVFVVTLVILGNPAISLATACVVGMIEVDILGCMKLWGIQLNAISLVNLLAAVAISIGKKNKKESSNFLKVLKLFFLKKNFVYILLIHLQEAAEQEIKELIELWLKSLVQYFLESLQPNF